MKDYLQRIIFIIAILTSGFVRADEDEKELAKASLNGLKVNRYAKHVAVPFQEYLNFDFQQNKTQSIFYLKPVVPFRISSDLDLIVRTIAPLYERTLQNKFDDHYINGWGDVNPTFFFTPAEFKSILVGFGPTVSIPTATNKHYIGTGKWSLGPEIAVYLIEDKWVYGFLTNNMWSVAGDSHRPAVNSFEFEYLISYISDQGWYVDSNPTITANWKSAPNQQWIVPIGIGVGRVFKYGKQPINVGIAGNYNIIRPNKIGSDWQLQLQVEWLFDPSSMRSKEVILNGST